VDFELMAASWAISDWLVGRHTSACSGYDRTWYGLLLHFMLWAGFFIALSTLLKKLRSHTHNADQHQCQRSIGRPPNCQGASRAPVDYEVRSNAIPTRMPGPAYPGSRSCPDPARCLWHIRDTRRVARQDSEYGHGHMGGR
jgi:hypothetical protein